MTEAAICRGCKAEIVNALPVENWSVVVRSPHGEETVSGPFCLGCMIEIAKLGVMLQNVTMVHSLNAGVAICGMVRGVPRDWPEGHTWVPAANLSLVTCPGCRDQLERA